MRKVERNELLGLGEYEGIRSRFRTRVIELKKPRRIAVGKHMTLVFENHDTMLLQIQEMLRTERLTDERSIAHELETYNQLIPDAGQLSATLFIEYEDPAERREMLRRFATLREQLYFCLGERRARAHFATHFGEEMDRLPAVNYVRFDVGEDAASRLRDSQERCYLAVTHPDYMVEVELSAETRRALADDLEG